MQNVINRSLTVSDSPMPIRSQCARRRRLLLFQPHDVQTGWGVSPRVNDWFLPNENTSPTQLASSQSAVNQRQNCRQRIEDAEATKKSSEVRAVKTSK